jgi:hypothetical protein
MTLMFILKVWGAIIIGLFIRSLLLRIIGLCYYYSKDKPAFRKEIIKELQQQGYSCEEACELVEEAMR